jgi:[ribosomal protein S5]-alanine N-acetyltransferase
VNDKLPNLRGSRVLLRWLTRDDVDALLEIFGDESVVRFTSIPRLRDRSDALRFHAEIESFFRQRTLFQWGLARVEDARLLGTCSLSDIHWEHQRAEVGFALGREHWGRGFMGEALPLLVRHAFEDLGFNRLEADVDPRNAASLHLLEKLGFRREGYLRQRYFQLGERQDSVLLGLLAEEWRAL